MEVHVLGPITVPLIFPNELPAQINLQPGGPVNHFARLLSIDLLVISEPSFKLRFSAQLVARNPSHQVKVRFRCYVMKKHI